MASSFSIVTTTNAITLDDDRKALVVFSVSNELGRSVRVRTSISPFEPTPLEWFTIDGEAERVFPPGGSEVFNVRIAVPPDAVPGSKSFRLDAVSSDRPDDEWAHGPLVGFEVLKPRDPPPPEVPKGYLETLLGALAGTVLALILVSILNVIVLSLLGASSSTFGSSFRILLFGEILALTALGAIGAVAGLVIRAIPDPARWRTGVAFGVLSTIILTIVNAILIVAIPLFPDTGGLIVTIVVTLIIVVVVALLARLIGRLLAEGKP